MQTDTEIRVESAWSGMHGTATRSRPPGWTIQWDDGTVDTEVISLLDPDFRILDAQESATSREP